MRCESSDAAGHNASAELYDPSTGNLQHKPQHGYRTHLPHGDAAQGRQGSGNLEASGFGGYLASAELYDASTGTFSSTGGMATGRYLQTATLLNNGKVFVIGGVGDTVYLASAELYDPSSGIFSPTGGMSAGGNGQTATLLDDGKVLVTGGHRVRRLSCQRGVSMLDRSQRLKRLRRFAIRRVQRSGRQQHSAVITKI